MTNDGQQEVLQRRPRFASVAASELLAVVHSELDELKRHVRLQAKRTSEIQRQLDVIHDLLDQILQRT